MDCPRLDSSVSSTLEEGFVPPPTLLPNHGKSLYSLLIFVYSSLLLVCSDSLSAFSSSNSLLKLYFLLADCYDYFDGTTRNNHEDLLSSGSKSPASHSFPIRSKPRKGQLLSNTSSSFNRQSTNMISKDKARLSLYNTNVRRSWHLYTSYYTDSLPLTRISSTFESAASSHTLSMDDINDAQVEFS